MKFTKGVVWWWWIIIQTLLSQIQIMFNFIQKVKTLTGVHFFVIELHIVFLITIFLSLSQKSCHISNKSQNTRCLYNSCIQIFSVPKTSIVVIKGQRYQITTFQCGAGENTRLVRYTLFLRKLLKFKGPITKNFVVLHQSCTVYIQTLAGVKRGPEKCFAFGWKIT